MGSSELGSLAEIRADSGGMIMENTYYAVALCKYRKTITILQLTSDFIVSSLGGRILFSPLVPDFLVPAAAAT